MSAPRVISLIGLPGSGKTTLGKALAANWGPRCTYFGVGEALRESAEADPSLRERLEDGRLGPEATVLGLVSSAYASCVTEFLVLDGFPRHVAQVAFARVQFSHWYVLHINITRDTALERLAVRRSCATCGVVAQATNHTTDCGVCGGRTWTTRAEDSGAPLRRRLEKAESDLQRVFSELTATQNVTTLDGNASQCMILERACSSIL